MLFKLTQPFFLISRSFNVLFLNQNPFQMNPNLVEEGERERGVNLGVVKV